MPPDRLPSLHAVRAFSVAARHLNFTAAAAELGVTQGAVSRIIQQLEADLGAVLFERRGRRLELTAQGARYHGEVGAGLDRIAAAGRALRRDGTHAVLRLNVIPTLGIRWLIPRLPAFQARHPEVKVDLRTGDGPVDLAAEGADLAIRYGAPPFANAAATRLMTEEMGVLCSPDLLSRGPALSRPADLVHHRLLRHSTRPAAWAEYLAPFGLTPPDERAPSSFEHFYMLAEAAVAGLGVALLPLFLFQEEIAAGRLVRPLPDTLRPDKAYHLLWQPGADRRGALHLFKGWILAQAEHGPVPARICKPSE